MSKTIKTHLVALTVDSKALRLIKKMEDREDIYVQIDQVQSGYVKVLED